MTFLHSDSIDKAQLVVGAYTIVLYVQAKYAQHPNTQHAYEEVKESSRRSLLESQKKKHSESKHPLYNYVVNSFIARSILYLACSALK